MGSSRIIRPSEKLETKYNAYVWLIFFLLVFPFVFLGFIPDLGWTYVWIFVAANVPWIAPALVLIPHYYRSIEYELGEEEIIVRKGIITKTTKTVPYRTVTNISVKRGPLDRWLGMGGIAIHTAGFSQQGGPEAALAGLEDYEGVYEDVFSALRRYRARTGQTVGAEELPEPSEAVAGLLREILGELRALRESLEQQAEE